MFYCAPNGTVNSHLRFLPWFSVLIPAHERNSNACGLGQDRAATRDNECSLQRDRRPRLLEILSSSAVNHEVGSFASSEVNRALKATTTFSLFRGVLFSLSLAPWLNLSLACIVFLRCGQEVRATLEESNKASRYDAAAGLLRCM